MIVILFVDLVGLMFLNSFSFALERQCDFRKLIFHILALSFFNKDIFFKPYFVRWQLNYMFLSIRILCLFLIDKLRILESYDSNMHIQLEHKEGETLVIQCLLLDSYQKIPRVELSTSLSFLIFH